MKNTKTAARLVGATLLAAACWLAWPTVRAMIESEEAFQESAGAAERLATNERRVPTQEPRSPVPAQPMAEPAPTRNTSGEPESAAPPTSSEAVPSNLPAEAAGNAAELAKRLLERARAPALTRLTDADLKSLLAELKTAKGMTDHLRTTLKTAAEGEAVAGLFNVGGEIKHREAGRLSLWGFAIPVNNDARQLGSQMREGNIVVLNPDIDGIVAGLSYRGQHAFLRTSSGTNAFGAAVPVSVYADIPEDVQERRRQLGDALSVASKAARDLFWGYARTRRALIALESAAAGDLADSNAVSAFILSVAKPRDVRPYFAQDARVGAGPLNLFDLRDEGLPRLHADGKSTEFGIPGKATVLGFSGDALAWVSRVHDPETLARYMPDAQRMLTALGTTPCPPGDEGLLGVIRDKSRASECEALAGYTVKTRVSTSCPEIVELRLVPSEQGARREVVLLCRYDGVRTSLLASTVSCPGSRIPDGARSFALGRVTADPLQLGWK